ncbi:MAG: adenine deaminase, partial [Chloroflexota bacterium]
MPDRRLAVARGDEPADLVFRGGSVLSVFTSEVFRADVAVVDGQIVGVGEYDGPDIFDATGTVLAPGFIDGHCHIESSKLDVAEFARAILPSGTTTVVVDPHELANVLGIRGVEYVLSASREPFPLRVLVMMPSCVPASRFESPAAPITAGDIRSMLTLDRVIGVAEVMNYPGAVAGHEEVLATLAAAGDRHIDGHAPGVTGNDLNAYILSGPSSDHECTTLDEALEKRRLGMWIMIREASMIRNLEDILPLVQHYGTENTMFVTDDREAGTLLHEGHINSMVAHAVRLGLSPGDAVKLGSLNVARFHGLKALGAIAPGFVADITVLPDLTRFTPLAVFKGGRLVADAGIARPFESPAPPTWVRDTVHSAPVSEETFRIPYDGTPMARCISLVRDQVVTESQLHAPAVAGGQIVADPSRDLVKLAVVERHHATGRVGIGLVRGFGLRSGAFASSIAHDAHNIIVAGVDDGDMA